MTRNRITVRLIEIEVEIEVKVEVEVENHKFQKNQISNSKTFKSFRQNEARVTSLPAVGGKSHKMMPMKSKLELSFLWDLS